MQNFENQPFVIPKANDKKNERQRIARTAKFQLCGATLQKTGNMTAVSAVRPLIHNYKSVISHHMEKSFVMNGIDAMQWAREISKLPDGNFKICFFPYSRTRGIAGDKLIVREHCKYRTQLPQDRFSVDAENYFLFTDGNEEPKMCYRILIRYMGFPQDGYKLHKINWL